MSNNTDIMDGIEPCRTCGIFYLTASNFLRKIFDSSTDEYDLSHIRSELSTWNVEINPNDGLPQYICTCCILEFKKVFKFRNLCIELQSQWRNLYNIREENRIYIKKELSEPDETSENICDFIYVDDLSDNEFNGKSDASYTPFNIPHIPIKEEVIEGAPTLNDNCISTIKNTYNESNIKSTERGFESNQFQNLMQMPDYDSKIMVSPVSPLLDNSVSSGSPFQLNDETVKPVQCNLCRHMSATTELHKQHMQRIHELKDMECHICGKQFKNTTATRLKFHLKWHRISKHIKCAQCGFFCDSRETLKEHTKAIHSKIECTKCGKRVLGKKMKVHMRAHGFRSWQCSYCDKAFESENVLEAHIWQIHAHEDEAPIVSESTDCPSKEEEQSLSCSQCSQLYPTQYQLNTHKLLCHFKENTSDDDSFNTELQSEQFHYSDRQDLAIPITNIGNANEVIEETRVHIESSYSSSIDNDFAQVISSDDESGDSESQSKEIVYPKNTQPFSNTDQLCTHYQQHLKKSELSCHICGKSFELKFSLNRHLKKHKNT
ncbi:PREDICTED: zinc finger protein 699 [Bactrocera latifrons]|uniref:Zinc finger protein 555 n=1 Tax=Bactrocera latifrons TaxID=174628 RepID=A0A0K8VXK7_BACLA|nr:PREDICTED: zinc finger protein 699 [Bactrocera latifrons]